MSNKRLHTEWLSLTEVSGPFLTLPVLERVFPQGLEAHDPESYRTLRMAYEEWEEGQGRPALDRAWIQFVLAQVLGLTDEVLAEGQAIPESIKATSPEHGETVRPDWMVRNHAEYAPAHGPRLLVQCYPPGQELEKPVAGRHWKASPATRMMELLHATDLRLGLVTNGEHWMLVHAPRGETTGYASWYAGLWMEEKVTLQAFRSLLGAGRFFTAASDTLEAMLAESAKHQQEVTDQLGYQVRRAVEVLIHSLDRADQDLGRSLLQGVPEADLYESALTVMMRLVFLLCAEERRLILPDDELYLRNYAIATLVDQLQETADQHGEEVLERRGDAWVRLFSTFRAVFGGVEHDRMRLPAYGGRLFDPDRFPFLEGRAAGMKWRETPARPLPVNNRTVLHLLRSLQYLEMQGEARRLSFRALDIEQIGHVYEGLLDHTARRAADPVLGLIGPRGDEPEVPLSRLETARAKGAAELLKLLKEETAKSDATLERLLAAEPEPERLDRLRAACGNDEALFARVRPFAALVRDDTFDRPMVIPAGSVYVTAGADRRSTATHYTQRSLTEPVVKHALDPLIYIGPAEGLAEWTLRSPRELLELKICDPACGSGAFLVQACRYLSERLVEAWENLGPQAFAQGITPFGEPATGAPNEALIPADADERLTFARRLVAQRCIYGVDKNKLAVEMAKLSLWLLTLAKDKPFEFLDHAIRHGDSLVGIHHLDQIRYFTLDLAESGDFFLSEGLEKAVDEIVTLRRLIEAHPADHIDEADAQRRLLQEADAKAQRLRLAADLLLSVEFRATSARQKEDLHNDAAVQASQYLAHESLDAFQEAAAKAMEDRPTFHWPLEFPEVFSLRITDRGLRNKSAAVDNFPSAGLSEDGLVSNNPQSAIRDPQSGFDAIVCNPPFIGGQKITGILGTSYRNYLVDRLANGKKGSADLSAYFFLQATRLLKRGGHCGLLATNTIAQGDTREVGLDQITASGGTIYRAVPSRPWPGVASLEIAEVWITNGIEWEGLCYLEGKIAKGITAFLGRPGRATGKPFRLIANNAKSFIGSYVLGMGFVLSSTEAEQLFEQDSHNHEVIHPFLNGEDINTRPDQSPSRLVINFHDWPLDRTCKGNWFNANETQQKKWLREGHVPQDYPNSVASDYPACLSRVHQLVMPERLQNNRKAYRDFWWHYAEKRPALYKKISSLQRFLVHPLTSKHNSLVFYQPGIIPSHMTVVLSIDTWNEYTLLQSDIHWIWALEFGNKLETRPQYTPSDCFETYPYPEKTDCLGDIGVHYYTHRQSIMLARQEGLTKTYNRFHNPEETSSDIQRLRELHQEMDEAVVAAYGWTELPLEHGFHETKQGMRFTISEAARREVLDRLLELNHQRYAEEVAQGLHEKGAKKKAKGAPKKKTVPAAQSMPLFGDEPAEPPAPSTDAKENERPRRAKRTT